MNGRQKSVSSSKSLALKGPYGCLGFRKNKTRKVHSVNPPAKVDRHSAPCTEVNLIRQVLANDPNAHEQLFEMYASKLYRTAFAILRNKEDAEDAVQDSWLRAYNKLNSFQGRSSFSTWLTRIAINSALMIFRRNRNARAASVEELEEVDLAACDLLDASPTPEQIYAEDERRTLLHEAIRTLRPQLRCVVELKQLGELSLNETARELGISLEAVKTRSFHAHAALRKSPTLNSIVRGRGELAA